MIAVLDVLSPDYVRQFVSRAEGGTVVLPDGTVEIGIPPQSPPEDVDIELMKVNSPEQFGNGWRTCCARDTARRWY